MIEVDGLSKKYGQRLLFENLSFRVKEGEGVFVLGASGCGKTTLLRILAGFEEEYQGIIRIDGQKMNPKIIPGKRNTGVVFQEPALWKQLTVRKNITYGMQQKDPELMMKVAQGLEIEELLDRYPEEISGGQAKRVSLARALLSRKTNLLLDEPLSNVDLKTKEIILEFLKEVYLENRCIVYITHDRDEVEKLPFKVFNMQV